MNVFYIISILCTKLSLSCKIISTALRKESQLKDMTSTPTIYFRWTTTKPTDMTPINKEQIIKISTLITKLGLTDFKDDMIYSVSAGRTKSRKGLYFSEAIVLIGQLEKENISMQSMIKKIFAIGYEIGFFYGDTPADKRINRHVLNQFLKKRGTVKKDISSMTKMEILKTVNQFERMKSNMQKSEISKMLSELNILTPSKTNTNA